MRKRPKIAPLETIRGSRDIAEYLGVDQQTVLNLVHKGQLPAMVLGNRLVARKAVLDAWVCYQEIITMSAAHATEAKQ